MENGAHLHTRRKIHINQENKTAYLSKNFIETTCQTSVVSSPTSKQPSASRDIVCMPPIRPIYEEHLQERNKLSCHISYYPQYRLRLQLAFCIHLLIVVYFWFIYHALLVVSFGNTGTLSKWFQFKMQAFKWNIHIVQVLCWWIWLVLKSSSTSSVRNRLLLTLVGSEKLRSLFVWSVPPSEHRTPSEWCLQLPLSV